MRDNISRSSIFRDSMRRKAEKNKEEQEKNIQVLVVGNPHKRLKTLDVSQISPIDFEDKSKKVDFTGVIEQISLNSEEKNIGREPGE